MNTHVNQALKINTLVAVVVSCVVIAAGGLGAFGRTVLQSHKPDAYASISAPCALPGQLAQLPDGRLVSCNSIGIWKLPAEGLSSAD